MVACRSSVKAWLPSLEGLPASRDSTAAHQGDGDHDAHRHVLIYGVGGAHDDRSGWPPNRHTHELAFRHEQAGLMITLVPWASSTLGKALIDAGIGEMLEAVPCKKSGNDIENRRRQY
jgi:hypothetical protein